MNTLLFKSFLISAFLVVPALARAESSVVTVDVNRILNESNEAKSKKKELGSRAAELRGKVESKRSVLLEVEKKLKDQNINENSPEAEKLRSEAREFERFVRDSDDELKKQFMKINKDLTDRVLKAVSDYAKEKKFLLVLDRGEKIRGAVLYGDPTVDITDEILKRVK